MNDAFLELEVRMLLARYGRHPLLRTLATVENSTIEEIENQLTQIRTARRSKKNKIEKTIADYINESLPVEGPTKEHVRRLVSLYENRSFLPELRSVRTFLRRHGIEKRLKSRNDGLRDVVKLLATLPEHTLQTLVDDSLHLGTSNDYTILANELMGSPRKSG
jgi:hypothetical protein